MRAVLLLVLLAACGASHARGPSWPKMAEKEVDGGETLTPRPGASAVAAAEAAADDSDDDDIKVVAPVKDTAKDTATPAKDAATPAKDSTDDPLQVEDIIIEIDD